MKLDRKLTITRFLQNLKFPIRAILSPITNLNLVTAENIISTSLFTKLILGILYALLFREQKVIKTDYIKNRNVTKPFKHHRHHK